MKVLCDAVPFGFGPIGKVLALYPLLPKEWSIVLLASHSSYALAASSGFEDIVLCDTERQIELERNKHVFLQSDIFINVMNPVSASFAKSIGIPLIEIDSLFWMWNKVPDYLLSAEVYYIQKFVGVEEQLSESHPKNPVLVGPIVDTRFISNERHNQLLIHLGGLSSKLIVPGKNSSYVHIIGKILSEVLKHHEFEKVIVACNRSVFDSGLNTWAIPRSTFVTLSHRKLLSELARSSLAITSPGLTFAYEAFTYRIPTVFLPPQNYSQFLILKRLRQYGAAPVSVHWLDFYPEMDMDVSVPEDVGVRHTLQCIERFRGDQDAQHQMTQYLSDNILSEERHIASSQQAFITRMGENGAQYIARDIKQRFNL